jgi:predicted nucleic acid-binding protein
MILADTSVVVEFLRTADPKLRHIIATEPAAVSGVTWAEILVGARDAAHRGRLTNSLSMFAQVPMPDPLWQVVGDHGAALRRGGVTVPFADVIIAAVAIANDLELWTRDNQFQHVQRILPALRLFTEPP